MSAPEVLQCFAGVPVGSEVNHYFSEGAICCHDLSGYPPHPLSGTCIVAQVRDATVR